MDQKISSSSEQGMRAVGIVGIGGSGKTTLASMVFNSREVRDKYQIMIWASLTSTLNKKESTRGSVLREILRGVQNNDSLKRMLQKMKYHQGGCKMGDHVMDKYIEHFKEALKRNSGKYLIVLDDVWETEYWFAESEAPKVGEPKCILSREWIQKTGGTVVVTSRLEEIAENIVGKRDVCMISRVSDDACFDIFLDRTTKDGYFKREDEQLTKLKKDIVSKCFGLPLAACTVADIFVAKHREEVATKEKDAAMLKAEAEKEANAAQNKAEADGEADVSKPKSEAEADASKPKGEAEVEADASKPKIEAEVGTDALKARAEAAGAGTKEEGAAVEAEVKEAATEPKAEEQAGKTKTELADISKAKSEAVEKVADMGQPDGTQTELKKDEVADKKED